MAITAADVKKLRDITGAGMMDAKKALTEADGDMDKAVELMRIAGQAKAAKRGAEREASAGLVASSGNAVVELKSETDFVAKNDQFISLADQLAALADSTKPESAEAFAKEPLPDGKSVEESISALAAVIGEKLELGRVAAFDGQSAVYLHRRSADLPPAVGVLVEFTGSEETARSIAMQIAAMRPQYLTREEVPAAIVAKEKEIAEATAKEEGKPEQIIPRIVEGRLNGFYKEVVLLEQASISEDKKSVQQVLEAAGTEVKRFARIEVGA